MKLIVISGRSGSGKSTALNVLEDAGFNCVDNLPISLISQLIEQLVEHPPENAIGVAVCIDARNLYGNISDLPGILLEASTHFECSLLYMDANDADLMKRFSETRRKHPLSSSAVALAEAIAAETELLAPLAEAASITINTTELQFHDLREHINQSIAERPAQQMSVLLQSFGFKYGVPHNADLMFDLRCLPNPFWNPELKHLPGSDPRVANYILESAQTQAMLEDVENMLARWLPAYDQTNRQYTTVAIGCTGGRHRSVCFTNALAERLKTRYKNTVVRHRDVHLADKTHTK